MIADTRVLIFRHGDQWYVVDFIPIMESKLGACSFDMWIHTQVPKPDVLCFDSDEIRQGFTVFEGYFVHKPGATGPVITTIGTYRDITPDEAHQLGCSMFLMMFPDAESAVPDDIEDIGLLRPDPWLSALVDTAQSEIIDLKKMN